VLAAIDLASQDIPSMSERRIRRKRRGPSARPAFFLERFKFDISPGFLKQLIYVLLPILSPNRDFVI